MPFMHAQVSDIILCVCVAICIVRCCVLFWWENEIQTEQLSSQRCWLRQLCMNSLLGLWLML